MDWLDQYLNGLGEYKTTVSPADTHIWGVKPKLNNIQERMQFDAAAQSELEFRQIVQEARTALEAHGEVADAVGADPGSPARSSTTSVTPTPSITPTITITPSITVTTTPTVTPTISVTPTITPSATTYPGMLAANSPLIAVNYGNVDNIYGTNKTVTRDYAYDPDVAWVGDLVNGSIYRFAYLDFNINIPGAWSFLLNDQIGLPNYRSYMWKNNSTNSQIVPSAGWYGFTNSSYLTGTTTLILSAIPVSPTPTPTITPTRTPTRTPTPTVTPTISVTPTITPTISITPSITPTITVTPTVSRSFNPGAFGTPQTIQTQMGYGGDNNSFYTRRTGTFSLLNEYYPTLSASGLVYISNGGVYMMMAPGTTTVDPNIPNFNLTFSNWTLGNFQGPDAYGNYAWQDNYSVKYPETATDAGNVPNIWNQNGSAANTYIYVTLSASAIAAGLSATSIVISGLSALMLNNDLGNYSYNNYNIQYNGGPRAIYNNSQTFTKTTSSGDYQYLWAAPQVADGVGGSFGYLRFILYYTSNGRTWGLILSGSGGTYQTGIFLPAMFSNYTERGINAPVRGIPLSGWNLTNTSAGSLFRTDTSAEIGYLRIR